MRKCILPGLLVLFVLLFLIGCDVLDSWQEPSLAISKKELDFDWGAIYDTFSIANQGGGTLEWEIAQGEPWLIIRPQKGTGNETVEVMVDRDLLNSGKEAGFAGEVKIESNGGLAIIPVKGNCYLPKEEKLSWDAYLKQEELPADYFAYDEASEVLHSFAGGTKIVLAVEEAEAFTKGQLYSLANNYFNYFCRAYACFGEHPLTEARLIIREEADKPAEISLTGWQEAELSPSSKAFNNFVGLPLARKVAEIWWGNVIGLADNPADRWLKEGLIEYVALKLIEEPEEALKDFVDNYIEKIEIGGAISLKNSLYAGVDFWEQPELFTLAAAGLIYYLESNFIEGWDLARFIKEKIVAGGPSGNMVLDTDLFANKLEEITDFSTDDDGVGSEENFIAAWQKYYYDGFAVPLQPLRDDGDPADLSELDGILTELNADEAEK